jgi:hypothetical protein
MTPGSGSALNVITVAMDLARADRTIQAIQREKSFLIFLREMPRREG